jgi:Zn-dependent peptidase ImmA (M78 family)
MKTYIAGVVEKLVRHHGTRNPFELCDTLDLRVKYMDLGKLLGYYACIDRIHTIVLNSHAPERMLRTVVAHELGHQQLHGKIAALHGIEALGPFSLRSPTENEANYFGAELLIPDDDLLDLLSCDDRTFLSIANEINVPEMLLPYKLDMLKHKGHDIQVQYEINSNFLKGKNVDYFEEYEGD